MNTTIWSNMTMDLEILIAKDILEEELQERIELRRPHDD